MRRGTGGAPRTSDRTLPTRWPAWLPPVVARVQQNLPHELDPSNRSLLRPAAVLVLLIDSTAGPLLLLTERAPKLRTDPGSLVFPGGAAEASDDGPVATALREAAEEVGIDPSIVHIIGLLPPLPAPGGAFLVTPVVGWCERLERRGPGNPAEVVAVVAVPLHEVAGRSSWTECAGALSVGGTAVGPMTTAVIDWLFGQP